MNAGYDQRQYEAMLHRIEQAEKEPIGIKYLGVLLNELDSLASCLEAPPAAWRKAFRREWAILEEVYSVVLNQERDGLSAQEDILIADSLGRMKQLMVERVTK